MDNVQLNLYVNEKFTFGKNKVSIWNVLTIVQKRLL